MQVFWSYKKHSALPSKLYPSASENSVNLGLVSGEGSPSDLRQVFCSCASVLQWDDINLNQEPPFPLTFGNCSKYQEWFVGLPGNFISILLKSLCSIFQSTQFQCGTYSKGKKCFLLSWPWKVAWMSFIIPDPSIKSAAFYREPKYWSLSNKT